jgi:transglutaminase-like putative cysteine protease
MTILRVHHLTRYTYRRPVGFGRHRLLFRPRDSYDQRLLQSTLHVSPEPSDLFWVHDAFGNCVAVADFIGEADHLCFETDIVLDHTPQLGPHFRADDDVKTWPFAYDADILPDLAPSMMRQYPGDPVTEAWARRFVNTFGPTDTARLLEDMTHAIKSEFTYSRRLDKGTQAPEVTLSSATGTCRDFALLMMEAARALGFAARFVTGYIYVPSRDTHERLGGGATHAWAQIFLPGAGWVEFDPTNGIIGNRDLIRVGVTRDPRQALP